MKSSSPLTGTPERFFTSFSQAAEEVVEARILLESTSVPPTKRRDGSVIVSLTGYFRNTCSLAVDGGKRVRN